MFLSKYETQIYALLRVAVGFLFLWHGSQKLFDFPSAGMNMPVFLVSTAGPIEFFWRSLDYDRPLDSMGGIHNQRADGGCVLDGSWNRALLPIVNHGELAVTYCFLFPLYFRQGSGVFSIDNFQEQRKKESACSEAGINDSGSGDLVNDAG